MIAHYRKKPVVIRAVQWTGDNAGEVKGFVGYRDNGENRFLTPAEITGAWDRPHVWDYLQEEWIPVNDDDFIIEGVQGEFYPCGADVFAQTYEYIVDWAVEGESHQRTIHVSDLQKVHDVLAHARIHHNYRDRMNAALHLSEPRFSPLTTELESALERVGAML